MDLRRLRKWISRQAVAVAVVARYCCSAGIFVDMYFTWMAGQNPDSRYTHYAIANMTGANRLLIGLGWSVLVFIFAVRFHRGIDLLNDKRTDLAFLGLATLYALFVSWKAPSPSRWLHLLRYVCGVYGHCFPQAC